MQAGTRGWMWAIVGLLMVSRQAWSTDELTLPVSPPASITNATTDAPGLEEKPKVEEKPKAEDKPKVADKPEAEDKPQVADKPKATLDDADKPSEAVATRAKSGAIPPVPPEPAAAPAADAPADAAASAGETQARSTPAAARASTPVAVTPPQPPLPPAPPKKPVLVPGTGALVKGASDDFEDEQWKWHYNHPKSSEEQDKRLRSPLGKSANGRWFEGPKRGTPDVVKRVPLPAPGLEGSGHGLLISTLNAGVPGRISYQMHQDDLIFNMQRLTGQGIHTADNPSVVVRVYMPPLEQWEQRSGPSFGFRAGCYTHAIITAKDHPKKGRFGLEEYWPGMFVCLEKGKRQRDGTVTQDTVYLRIRGGKRGGEIRGPTVEQLGWWTLGLSFSPDGMVHYFAKPGLDELTMDDHITSQFPYGYRAEWFKTFFFNVCNHDDGRTWSTPWVIDDPQVYSVRRPQVASPGQNRRNR